MKASRLSIVIVTGISLLSGCQKDPDGGDSRTGETPRIKKYSTLVSPGSNTKHTIGDEVAFKLKAEKEIDSVIFEYRDQQLKFGKPEFQWSSKNARTGVQKLKLTAYVEGNAEVHYPKIRFLSDVTPEQLTYQVISVYPHNTDHYTQGLFFKEDTLFESTGPGPRKESKLAKVALTSGEVYQSTLLQSKYFGEGSTWWGDKIIMLTWTSQTGFVFDFDLKETGTFGYTHEGWGITHIGDTLYVSDGSEVIHLLNPRDFSEFDKLEVYDDENKVVNLNELEAINGLLYANIYQEDLIVVIDPASGKILREIDMTGILDGLETGNEDVLNGIAYNPLTGKTYVTGKLWPKLFEVEFTKQ